MALLKQKMSFYKIGLPWIPVRKENICQIQVNTT